MLGEPDPAEKTREEVLKDAAELHELLRTYGSVKDQDKPLVVAGILLALDEIGVGSFKLDDLTGDGVEGQRDGDKIMGALDARLRRSNVGDDKRKRLLAEFQLFTTNPRLNDVHPKLKTTPLRVYAAFLYDNIFTTLKAMAGGEDFIGLFYGEFMRYSGGDGQTLGIVLTPAHVCSLMCDLVKLKPRDSVLDPACGTGGFLVEAMRRMLADARTAAEEKEIKEHRIHGFELQGNMFVAAASNMILHGDGQSNIACLDFLKQDPAQTRLERKSTVGLMNPPYSQGTKSDPGQYELAFIEKLLDSLEEGGRAAVIVPQSSMTGKTAEERALKRNILKKHTLEGVVTCNPDTFYGVGVQTVIAVFTAHEPHPEEHACRFVDFRDDGWKVRRHVGLVREADAAEKKRWLLAVWNGDETAPSRFCVKAAVGPDDEWLHGFFWFNEDPPSEADFEKAVGDYLTFEFSMVMQGRGFLFERSCAAGRLARLKDRKITDFREKAWKAFAIEDLFTVAAGEGMEKRNMKPGSTPFVGASSLNNGVTAFTGSEGRLDSLVLGVNANGSVGEAFVHPYACLFSGDVKRLHLKNGRDGEAVLLFCAQAIRMQREKYSYGYKFSSSRMSRQKIMLPVDGAGEPDWAYMEQYVKNMMAKKLRQFQAFLGAGEGADAAPDAGGGSGSRAA